MNSLVVVLSLICLAVASPNREKRQVNCVDPFQNVPSPCGGGGPSQRIYFPHPTDNTKFLQCDNFGRMYIIQCPQGEAYQSGISACRPTAAVTQAPFVPPVVTNAPVIQPSGTRNPCTATAISRGLLYYPVVGDKTKFIECDLAGNPSTLSCATGLLWDQGMLSCVYPINAGVNGNGQVTPSVGTPNTSGGSPCTAAAINSGHFFFPNPNDATKFIQCDLWGNANDVSCPTGLVWNAYLETCYRPFQGVVGK